MRIEECVTIVTGGASGLGEGAVRLFHSLGGKVAIWDVSEDLGTKIASELGKNVIFCKVDVGSEDSVRAALKETVTRLGNVQILVNSAGINHAELTITPTTIHPLADSERIMRVNLTGIFNVSRIVAKHISEQNASGPKVEGFIEKGVIVHVASILAFEGEIGRVVYSASKGGVVGMTLPMARDLAGYGIRVNTIAPGLFGPTGMTVNIDKKEYQAKINDCPIKRWGEPREFAHAVKFLVENTYMNGTTIRIDGGARSPNL